MTEQLSEKAEPTICCTPGCRTLKFAELLISVLLVKPRSLKRIGGQPNTNASLFLRRTFDRRKKAGTETLTTTGFGHVQQFNKQPPIKDGSPNTAGWLTSARVSYDDGDISIATRSTTNGVIANQGTQQRLVIASIR